MARTILRTLTLLALLASVGFGLLWLDRVRLDYNSEGRYFDERAGVVFDISAVMVYGTIALFMAILGALTFSMSRKIGSQTHPRKP